MSDPAVPPTPPVPLAALLAREDLALRQIAGPSDPDIVIHWAHTSEMADPYPYLLGGELLLTAGVHIPEAAGSGTYFDDYVARIVAAGGAALGFGVAPVHDTVPRALVAACEAYELPLVEVPPQTTFSGVARAVWQLMAQARLAELRRVTEAQQSLAAAASRPDPIPSVLHRLAQRVGGRAVLYGPEGTEIAAAGRAEPGRGVPEALAGLAEVVRPSTASERPGGAPPPPAGGGRETPAGTAETVRPGTASRRPDGPPPPAGAVRETPAGTAETVRPGTASQRPGGAPPPPAGGGRETPAGTAETVRPGTASQRPGGAPPPAGGGRETPAGTAEAVRPSTASQRPGGAPPPAGEVRETPAGTAEAMRPGTAPQRPGGAPPRQGEPLAADRTAPAAGGSAGSDATGGSAFSDATGGAAGPGATHSSAGPGATHSSAGPGATRGTAGPGATGARITPVAGGSSASGASGARPATSLPAAAPTPTSATDTIAGTHLAAYALGAGQGFVLGVTAPRRQPGDHAIASVAAVLLALLTGEHQSGTGAARSSALVRVLLGAAPEAVAPLLGGERWVVVHARPDGHAPDAVASSALGASLGSPLVDLARDVVRVLVPAEREPAPQPGWTLGVSAAVGPGEWASADAQAGRALARARATRTPLVRHGARPALADLVPEEEAEAHARALLAPLTPVLAETLRTWLSLHGSWDRTAVALGVHRNTVRQRIARCAALLAADLDEPDVRMELWFALRRL
ncbi:PucR family transcriptional regulator ligand-binding domain-containing protein [Streptomyces plumbiresistens]|uniref:Regulatory protein n=1 Tax=Streptomyces plumbiresistens TaxID=511811 RepID=A0ABP7T1D8_9ACTN